MENIIRHIPKIIPRAHHHPTAKPKALVKHFINLHTLPNDLILDPFMGSGVTLVAAKEMGRRAIGVELEEKWCREAAEACGVVDLRLVRAAEENGRV